MAVKPKKAASAAPKQAKPEAKKIAAVAEEAVLAKIDVQLLFASSWQITITGTEINLLGSRQQPVFVQEGGQQKQGTITEAAFAIAMSPQAAKDLSVLLSQNLAELEKDWGPIETPYTRRLASKAAAEAKARTRRKPH